MASPYETRVWRASKGILEPSARQVVKRGIYDELKMPATMDGVTFDYVAILCGVVIKNGTARGTIILPEGTTTVDLGGSLVNVLYWSWARICKEYRA